MAKVANPFGMSCVLSTIGLLALILNSCVVVRYGRRRVLLMSGLVTCGVLQLIVAVVYDKNPGTKGTGRVIVALTSLYMFSYNVSISQRDCLVVQSYAYYTTGSRCALRVADGRRNAITTSSKLHFRTRSRSWLFHGMAYSIYSTILYQPTVLKLGPEIRLYLVSDFNSHRRLGILLST